jgi:hypothetical protein
LEYLTEKTIAIPAAIIDVNFHRFLRLQNLRFAILTRFSSLSPDLALQGGYLREWLLVEEFRNAFHKKMNHSSSRLWFRFQNFDGKQEIPAIVFNGLLQSFRKMEMLSRAIKPALFHLLPSIQISS